MAKEPVSQHQPAKTGQTQFYFQATIPTTQTMYNVAVKGHARHQTRKVSARTPTSHVLAKTTTAATSALAMTQSSAARLAALLRLPLMEALVATAVVAATTAQAKHAILMARPASAKIPSPPPALPVSTAEITAPVRRPSNAAPTLPAAHPLLCHHRLNQRQYPSSTAPAPSVIPATSTLNTSVKGQLRSSRVSHRLRAEVLQSLHNGQGPSRWQGQAVSLGHDSVPADYTRALRDY